jgi:hypothetical protein
MKNKSPSFRGINHILNKVVANLGLDKRLREHTLMNMWPNYVSEIIAQKSRPLFIDSESNLVITASDAVIAQELSMQKRQLLKQLNSTAIALDLEIKGIRFDLKHFHANNNQENSDLNNLEISTPDLPKISKEDLDLLTLSESQKQELSLFEKEMITKLQETKLSSDNIINSSDNALMDRIKKSFERALKLSYWQRINGYPVCSLCNNPTERLHRLNNDNKNLCFVCYLQSK